MRKLFVVTALITSSQLQAQSLPQERKDTLENVTLTASKFSTKTTETGKVVVTINRQQLEKAGSRDLSQVITELGGVFINGYTNNAGKDKSIYLRGAKVDYTLITVDGIPVYDASGIGSNFDIRYIPVDAVERVEILKGSQSTLYGSDAIAGVVNIITRKGGTKPVSGSGVVNYGHYNTWRANAGFNGAVKAFDYNLAFTHLGTDGFSEAQQPATVSRPYDKDWYKQNSLQANFGVKAARTFRIQPFIRYSKNSGALDNDAFIDEQDFTYNAKNLQAGVKNTIGIGNAQVAVLYQLNKTERNYLDDSTLSRNGFYKFNQSAYKAMEHFAEAFVVYPFHAFRLTAGGDYRSANTDYSAHQISAFGASKPLQSGDSVKQAQTSLYAALNYTQNDFSLEGGGRFNHHSVYGNNFAFNFNPSYLVEKRVKVFANVSTGYKTPSLYQLFSVYGNKDLEPETSLNLEGGAQVFFNGNKGAVRATYFNRKVSDVIAFFYNPATFRSSYINQDKQHDHGVELDANFNLTDKIQLRAFYSYVDGKITTLQNGKDTTYFNLLRRPKHTVNVFAGMQITSAFYVSVNANRVGERKDIYFDPVTFASQPVTLKPYTLVNMYAEYGFLQNRFKLFADFRNVLDESYSDIYGYNTAGFNAYGGFRFRF
ncbi:MAG TPA: TonB-dependent receptor [Flavisolibacter sp.]|jgi:vitamin B12 transporter|nr:TonB-dependent receptor [Flavisolibacter sp.]